MAFFEAKTIKKNFGGVKALVSGEVTLHKGKILGLIGANGSGKSTLSKIICGIHTPCGGQLMCEGKEVIIRSPQEAEKLGIVMVHQHLSLIPELNVWQNIMLGREEVTKGGYLKESDNIDKAKKALWQLTKDIDLYEQVKNLSPAQKQLVEIAKALSRDPKLLILDEPTAALNQAQVEILFNLLMDLREKGICMVFISHRIWEVTKLCDHISVFRNGNTVGHIDFELEEIDERKIISMITGKDRKEKQTDAKRTKGMNKTSVLKVHNIGSGNKVRGVDIDLKEGEIVGIAGLHGQGQEELLMLLSGFMRMDYGTVSKKGKKLGMKSPKECIRNKIVLVPGDRHEEGVFLSHNILDNLIYPSYSNFKSKIFVNKNNNKTQANQVISKMNISPANASMLVANLSGGNQQKVVVGKWLQIEPEVLLLSDPAKGVDVNAKEEMYNIVGEMVSRGTSVVIYASDKALLMKKL